MKRSAVRITGDPVRMVYSPDLVLQAMTLNLNRYQGHLVTHSTREERAVLAEQSESYEGRVR